MNKTYLKGRLQVILSKYNMIFCLVHIPILGFFLVSNWLISSLTVKQNFFLANIIFGGYWHIVFSYLYAATQMSKGVSRSKDYIQFFTLAGSLVVIYSVIVFYLGDDKLGYIFFTTLSGWHALSQSRGIFKSLLPSFDTRPLKIFELGFLTLGGILAIFSAKMEFRILCAAALYLQLGFMIIKNFHFFAINSALFFSRFLLWPLGLIDEVFLFANFALHGVENIILHFDYLQKHKLIFSMLILFLGFIYFMNYTSGSKILLFIIVVLNIGHYVSERILYSK